MDSVVTKPWHSANFCNLAGALRWQAERQPGTTAVHHADFRYYGPQRYTSYNYLELNELTDAYARGLAEHGFRSDDRVVLMAEPDFPSLALFYALLKVGAIPVLVDPGQPVKTIGHCIRDAAPQAFIGSARSNLQRLLRGWGRETLERSVSTGRGIPGAAIALADVHKTGKTHTREVFRNSRPEDVAAIFYTAGRQGDPRGVIYRQRHFSAQVDALREAFGIAHGEVSLSTHPVQRLLDPALGVTTVIPKVDANKPDDSALRRMLDAVEQFRVNNIFLSPGMFEALSIYGEKQGTRLQIVRRIITSGATPGMEAIARVEKILHDEARIHVSYGSVECFPVSSITNHAVDSELVEMMECGEGVCVGEIVAPNRVKIIAPSAHPFGHIDEVTELPPGMAGEIVVCSPACSDSYWRDEDSGRMANMTDDAGQLWHRMGDFGSLDGMGRLWFCGRVTEAIDTGEEVLYPDQAEAIFNQHPDASRTALVGVGEPGRQMPVLCVELRHKLKPVDMERVHFDLLQLAQSFGMTRSVRTVMFHPGFPLDPRNPAAIQRNALAKWAARKVN